MKESHHQVINSSYKHRLPGSTLAPPHVLVAAEYATSAQAIATTLRTAGYSVSVAQSATGIISHLRSGCSPIQLLVLDGSNQPWVAGAILDSLRYANWPSPIILIAGRDPELRAEAKRLGVDAVVRAPPDTQRLRTVATRLVPVGPELSLRGGRGA